MQLHKNIDNLLLKRNEYFTFNGATEMLSKHVFGLYN